MMYTGDITQALSNNPSQNPPSRPGLTASLRRDASERAGRVQADPFKWYETHPFPRALEKDQDAQEVKS